MYQVILTVGKKDFEHHMHDDTFFSAAQWVRMEAVWCHIIMFLTHICTVVALLVATAKRGHLSIKAINLCCYYYQCIYFSLLQRPPL